MIRKVLVRWLRIPLVTGWPALLCAIAAVALPTLARAAINGSVTGCEFTPYLPFVLICAIILGGWQASGVALASVGVLGGLFTGPLTQFQMSCFISAAGIFLAASGMMIGTAVLIRRAFAMHQRRSAEETAAGLSFSLDQGEVWASWCGQGEPLRLGSQRKVAQMMRHFLEQSGER